MGSSAKPDPNLKRIWRQSLHYPNGTIREVHGDFGPYKDPKVYFIMVGDPIPAGVKIGDIVHEQEKFTPVISSPGARTGIQPTKKDKYVYYYNTPKPPTGAKPEEEEPVPSEVITSADVGTSKFNPPPHAASRTLPPTALAGYTVSSSADRETIRRLQRVNQRGYFFQDMDNAYMANGDFKTKASQLWGFQFMYNPTTISHSLSNANFDITNTADISNQLTGNQTFSVNLFINRVMDMSALASDRAQQSAGTGDYSRALTTNDIHGILTRGTEYDLEFLYRVCNGEPQLGPSMDRATSDFGFIAPAPIWFRLNDNFKYKVVVTSISVNHVMFTEKMIPILSEVSIGMMRIPTPSYETDTTDTFLTERYTTTDDEGKTGSKLPVYGAPADTEASK